MATNTSMNDPSEMIDDRVPLEKNKISRAGIELHAE
jgi:hypothetical protein